MLEADQGGNNPVVSKSKPKAIDLKKAKTRSSKGLSEKEKGTTSGRHSRRDFGFAKQSMLVRIKSMRGIKRDGV